MKNKSKINISMQISKLIASMFVVFIHFSFPGKLGKIIDCIARFAVPMFFVISGYFSYKIDNDKIKKRIIHMLKLNIFTIFLYLVLNIIETVFINNESIFVYLHSVFNLETIAKWFIINVHPIQGHLWYLSSILFVYIFLWIYVRFIGKKTIDYKPLYILGVFLICINIMVSSYSSAAGIELSFFIYRNALFWGLPMFCLGIFINQHQKRILKNFNLSTKKLIVISILGVIFSLIEYIGIGKLEMPIGMIFTVLSLMLLAIKYPNYNLIKNRFILLALNKVSLIIYIIHPLSGWLLVNLFNTNIHTKGYLFPFAVLGLSIIISLLYTLLIFLIKKNKSI